MLLSELSGRPDFHRVADCKLFRSRKSLEYIDKQNGRFITVLPRNRREDKLSSGPSVKVQRVAVGGWPQTGRQSTATIRQPGCMEGDRSPSSPGPSKEGYRINLGVELPDGR